MKRMALLGLMMVSAVALFANGAREIDREPVWNPVEITGTVSVVDGYPVLTARGDTYLLGAPRAAWYVDAIEDGQTVTIRGHLVEDPVMEVDVEVDAHIAVDQAVVDGEVLVLGFRGGMAGRGPGFAGPGGMHGGRRMSPRGSYGRPFSDDERDDRPYGDPWGRDSAPRGRW